MNELQWILLILLASVSAHITIAWTAIAVHTRRAEVKWKGEIRTQMIPEAVSAVKAELPSRETLRTEVRGLLDDFRAGLPRAPTPEELRSQLKVELAEFAKSDELGSLMTDAFGSYLESPDGAKILDTLGARVALTVQAGLEKKLQDADGAEQRSAQSAAEKMLMGQVRFKSPIANGLWAIVPPSEKRMLVRTFYKAFRGGNGIAALEGSEPITTSATEVWD